MNSTSINLYSLTPNFSSSSSSSSCKFANFFNKSLKKLTTTVNFSSIAVSTAKSTSNIRFFPVLAIKPHKFFTKFTRTVDSSSVPISSRAKHRFCPKSFNKFTTTIDFNSIAISSTAKNRISPIIATLAANPTFVSGLLAWFLAQSVKVILNFFVERKWEIRVFCRSGGMPSSHSALCTALTTSVAICKGIGDALFAVCLGFSLIVMYDAIGVRRHAGMQAEVLNKIVEDLFQGHPISERKLKELLGHTPSQVLAGAVLGIAVACFCCQSCLVAA